MLMLIKTMKLWKFRTTEYKKGYIIYIHNIIHVHTWVRSFIHSRVVHGVLQ